MRAFILAALVAASPAYAEFVYFNGDLRVTFHDSPCDVPVIVEALKEEGTVLRATVRVQGNAIKACYIVDGDGDYLVVDAQGRGGFVPGQAVKPGKPA